MGYKDLLTLIADAVGAAIGIGAFIALFWL